MGDISQHFSSYEVRCRCGGCEFVMPSALGMRALEDLRGLLGVPVYLTSCGRCPVHNYEVGGAERSRHLTFWGPDPRAPDAFDIVVPAMGLKRLFYEARQVPAFSDGGIGVYPWWPGLHLDVRGTKARWFQETKGAETIKIPGSYYL